MEEETFFSKKKLIDQLTLENKEDIANLLAKANNSTEKLFSNKVFLRGIIEPSNICQKDCYYCALRKTRKIVRFKMKEEEIVDAALFAYENGFGSIVLQSGENSSLENIDFFVRVISSIKEKTKKELGITLSLGELSKEIYKKLFDAGAHRYLLRIETSSPFLYSKLHPEDHSFQRRIGSLEDLKEVGYQVGTGVMIGLPFQTYENLADDLLFFKKLDIDMIGMGPYIPHEDTPLYSKKEKIELKDPLILSLKMIALARLLLKDVNIAATTALDILDPRGRERALLSGANVIMPICTPLKYRKDYKLYENSSLGYENPDKCLHELSHRLALIGKEMAFGILGDPIHYYSRRK